jgi:hypothetical protein
VTGFVRHGEYRLSDKAAVLRRIRRFLLFQDAITLARNAELANQEGNPA